MIAKMVQKLYVVGPLLLASGTAFGGTAVPVQPQTGTYVMTGKIASVVRSGGAVCDKTGAALKGAGGYKPAFLEYLNEQLYSQGGLLGIVIFPDAEVASGISYSWHNFPVYKDSKQSGNASYVLTTIPFTGAGTYSITAGTVGKRNFTVTLTTTTGSQDGGSAGTCKTTYSLAFTFGIPANVKNLLKSLM